MINAASKVDSVYIHNSYIAIEIGKNDSNCADTNSEITFILALHRDNIGAVYFFVGYSADGLHNGSFCFVPCETRRIPLQEFLGLLRKYEAVAFLDHIITS